MRRYGFWSFMLDVFLTLQYQFMPLHNTTAKIMVVDEGVRFLPAPQPRTDGTIFDQMVAEYGYNPLAA